MHSHRPRSARHLTQNSDTRQSAWDGTRSRKEHQRGVRVREGKQSALALPSWSLQWRDTGRAGAAFFRRAGTLQVTASLNYWFNPGHKFCNQHILPVVNLCFRADQTTEPGPCPGHLGYVREEACVSWLVIKLMMIISIHCGCGINSDSLGQVGPHFRRLLFSSTARTMPVSQITAASAIQSRSPTTKSMTVMKFCPASLSGGTYL